MARWQAGGRTTRAVIGTCYDGPHLTQRALASLSAELTRRGKVLVAAGAKDIEEYTERGSLQPRYRPLPRLVIVIDEFASLVRDLPDFMTGLVGIVQQRFQRPVHRLAGISTHMPGAPGEVWVGSTGYGRI